MANTLRTILTTGAIGFGLASLLPIKNAEAQVSGNVEYIHSETKDNSYPRLNVFYSLPNEIKGYTFAEFYKAGKGYFGRTNFNRYGAITSGVGPRITIVHAGAPFTSAGFGVGAVVPFLPRNVSATVGIEPVWFDNEGKPMKNMNEIQYFANADLPLGFNINSFGNINVADQNGPQWEYGEISLGHNIGPFRVSYNPALFNQGNVIPRLEHRVAIGLNFGGKK